jgi:glycosyltransferase involved in cell wall biosynthesis
MTAHHRAAAPAATPVAVLPAVDVAARERGGRRHVLQLIETGGPGGAERVLVSLTAALSAEPGYRASAGLLKTGWLEAELERRALPVHRFRLKSPLDPGLVFDLARYLRRERVTLVHAHEFTMNVYGAAAAWCCRVPVIATVHGRGYYAGARRRLAALRLAAASGAILVAVSSDIQQFLKDRLGLDTVRRVPNGIDLQRPASGKREMGRRALGLGPEPIVIGTIGNLYPVKGHRVLLAALARLESRPHLAIAGRGKEEAALRAQAEELGIADRVHFLGYREDTPDLLAAFDIYALPSLFEGQSLALIEAMAAGLPIAATAVGGNPEVLGRSEEEGLFVRADDASALARAIERLMADPELRSRLGRAALTRARAEFGLETMLGRYRTLYAEALERRPPRGGGR